MFVQNLKKPLREAAGHYCPPTWLITTALSIRLHKNKGRPQAVRLITQELRCTLLPAVSLPGDWLHICASIFDNISDLNCVFLWSVKT